MKTKEFLITLVLLIIASGISFSAGFGYQNQKLIQTYGDRIISLLKNPKSPIIQINTPTTIKVPPPKTPQPSRPKVESWTGPQFWQEIADKRQEQGLSPIPVNELLCTLSAIRLADIRRLGHLDDHEGFKPLVNKYQEDLAKADLTNLYEFLTSGAPTANAAVEGLFDTLGHKALFTDIYKAGCAYAGDTFGVVITSK